MAQARFEDIVGGAHLHRLDRDLLIHGPGKKDKRQIGPEFPGDFQRREAVERRQGIVGEDDVEGVPELCFEVAARLNPDNLGWHGFGVARSLK